MTITRFATVTTLAAATVCLSACSSGSSAASHTVTKTVTASPSSDDQSADTAADDMPQKVTPSLYHAYSWTYGLAEGDKGSTDPRDGDLPPYILPKNAETIRTSEGALTVGLNLRYTSMHDSTPALTCDNDLALSHALIANEPNQDVACPTNAADVPVTWSINQSYRPTKVSATNLPDPVKVATTVV